MSSRFPCVTPGVERFSLDLPQADKSYRECALELGCGELGDMVKPWLHRICNCRLISGKLFWIDYLRLEQAMRNLTCGGQEVLLMVIWLVLRRIKTE